MAQTLGGGRVRLNDGKVVSAQQGGWYDGQQFFNDSLSSPGVIHSSSNQQGAGQAVSAEVNRQSSVAQGKAPNAIEEYLAQQRATQGGGGGGGAGMGGMGGGVLGSGSGMGFAAPEVLNLPKLYESLYANSGIRDLESDLSNKEKQFIEAQGKVNDNPFLSEATRMGRVAKLDDLYQKRTANLRNDIATRKADIETKLNLETKQFDINSQAAQQAMNQFNTLLQMGALDNASGEDIANITRSTGLSSAAISSAVNAQRQRNRQTQVIQTDDGESVNAVVIDTQTGEVISSTRLASSKPTKGSGGGGGGGGLTPAQSRTVVSTARKALAEVDAGAREDKLLSVQEYQRAIQILMNNTGIDFATAENVLDAEFSSMGYKKYKW